MGWPNYLHNLPKAELVKLGKHWNLQFEETTVTHKDLRTLLRTHATAFNKTESDIPADVDPAYTVLLKVRSRTPSPKPAPQFNVTNATPKGGQSTSGSPGHPQTPQPDPTATLCDLVSNVLTTVQEQQSFMVHQFATKSSKQSGKPKASKFVVDRETRVNNVVKECKRKEITFSGKPGENVRRFIIKFQEIIKIYHCSDVELERILYEILTGPALEDFKGNLTEYADWDSAKDRLLEEFSNEDLDYEVEKELLNRKQFDGETIAEYLADLKLLNKCQTEPFSPNRLIRLACKNVNPNYYKPIKNKQFATLEDIRKAGQKWEFLNYEKEHFYDDIPKKKKEIKPKLASARSTSVSSQNDRECFGCGTEGLTLNDCQCEVAQRYRARKERRAKKKTSGILKRGNSQSPGKVRYKSKSKSSSHSETESGSEKRLSRKEKFKKECSENE